MTVRVVVVDANADYRFLVRAALRGSSLEVVAEAETAAAAVAAATKTSAEVVVVDPVLPDETSLKVVGRLRAAVPEAAIVVSSAYPEDELWLGPLAARRTSFLSKAWPALALADALLVRLDDARRANERTVPLAEERAEFPPDGRSVAAARRFARQVLVAWDCEDVLDAVVLLVSELVTNAVIHARTRVEVVLASEADRVRVEVIDGDREHIRRRDAADEDQSGRGMALIESLTIGWGVETLATGKAVWFEVPRSNRP